MFTTLFLIACEASRLGVVLPEGGAEAISQEDLQRDVAALAREDATTVLARRFAQVHVSEVVSGDHVVCGRIDGGPGPAVVILADWPADLRTRVPAAALISLGKALDGARPPRTTWLCAARADRELPSGAPPRTIAAVALAGQPQVEAYDQVDWRVVESEVRAQFATDIDLNGAIGARAAAHAAGEKLKRSRGPGTSAKPSPP